MINVNKLFHKISEETKTLEYVMEPMKLLQGYPYAEQILGRPITLMNLKIDQTNVQLTELQTKVSLQAQTKFTLGQLFHITELQTKVSLQAQTKFTRTNVHITELLIKVSLQAQTKFTLAQMYTLQSY